MHITGLKWAKTDPDFLVANQPAQVDSPSQGQLKPRNLKGEKPTRCPPGARPQPGMSPVLFQQASPQLTEGGVNSSTSKMRKPESERLSNLSEITQVASSGAGI